MHFSGFGMAYHWFWASPSCRWVRWLHYPPHKWTCPRHFPRPWRWTACRSSAIDNYGTLASADWAPALDAHWSLPPRFDLEKENKNVPGLLGGGFLIKNLLHCCHTCQSPPDDTWLRYSWNSAIKKYILTFDSLLILRLHDPLGRNCTNKRLI